MELVFKEDKAVSALHKKQVSQMLSMTSKESIVLLNNKYWSEVGRVAMGSTLG